MQWECAKGHQWQTAFGNIKYNGAWCKECRTDNLYEEMTRDILQKLFGKPFKNVRNALTSRLELDCFNEELQLAVEYQGKQHYQFIEHFHRTQERFEQQQERDARKRSECEQLGITLIEIHYKCITYTKIKDALIAQLLSTQYGDMMNLDQEWPEFFEGHANSRASKELAKLAEKAESRGGQLLSTTYGGSFQKLQFKCAVEEHPPFMMQPNNLMTGQWCMECKATKPKPPGHYEKVITDLGCTFLTDYKNNFTDAKGRRQCHHYIEFLCQAGEQHKMLNGNLNKWIKKGHFRCTQHR
jgi:hypothetical protein